MVVCASRWGRRLMPPFRVTVTVETHYDVVVQASDENSAERIAFELRDRIPGENQPRDVEVFVDGVSEVLAVDQAPSGWNAKSEPYADRGRRAKALGAQLPAKRPPATKPAARVELTPDSERFTIGDRIGQHED